VLLISVFLFSSLFIALPLLATQRLYWRLSPKNQVYFVSCHRSPWSSTLCSLRYKRVLLDWLGITIRSFSCLFFTSSYSSHLIVIFKPMSWHYYNCKFELSVYTNVSPN